MPAKVAISDLALASQTSCRILRAPSEVVMCGKTCAPKSLRNSAASLMAKKRKAEFLVGTLTLRATQGVRVAKTRWKNIVHTLDRLGCPLDRRHLRTCALPSKEAALSEDWALDDSIENIVLTVKGRRCRS